MSLFMWNLIYSKHRREEFLSSANSKYFEYIHWEKQRYVHNSPSIKTKLD